MSDEEVAVAEPTVDPLTGALIPPMPGAPSEPLPALTASAELLSNLLTVIEKEIVPLTEEGVQRGNKVFGAAIVQDLQSDNSCPLVVARTNAEQDETPLFHGEVHCLYAYSKSLSSENKPAPSECLFVSTHEPCCMCISSIVWSGFTRVYYLFGYEETRGQGIPHDLNIMHELWGVPTYRRQNKFLTVAGIPDLVQRLNENDDEPKKALLLERIEALRVKYDKMSHAYHSSKPKPTEHQEVRGGAKIPFA